MGGGDRPKSEVNKVKIQDSSVKKEGAQTQNQSVLYKYGVNN